MPRLEILLHVDDNQAYIIRRQPSYCNVGKTIHIHWVHYSICVLHEAMDNVIIVSNLILEDIKICLILKKLLQSWGPFPTMNSNIKSLPKLLTTIRHEDTRRQEKVTNQPMAKAISINRYQPVNSLSQIKQVTKIMDNEVIHMALNKVELQGDMVVL